MSRRLRSVRFTPAGPAGEVIQAAERIGWTWPAWSVLRTGEGAVLDMEKICPQDIKAMVQLASEKAHWSKWAAPSEQWKDMPQGPWPQPVMQVLVRRKQAGWTARHTAAAKNILAGGLWTQLPRYDCGGLTTSPLCQLCEVQDGTPSHRLDGCHVQQLVDLRRTRMGANWRHVAKHSKDSMLWTRGLLAHPEAAHGH